MQIVTIEDCLEMMAGLTTKPIVPSFIILDKDKQILQDIAKKVWKGMALTDRQYDVVKQILISRYSSQFKHRDIDLQNSVNNLRQPLRHLDRSTYIRIENADTYGDPIWSGYKPAKVVVVRFPFNMTYSKIISDIKKLFPDLMTRFYHPRIKDQYLFPYNERIVHKLVSRFKNKITDIDKTLLDVYEQCEKIKKESEKYVPGIYDYKIKNSSEVVTKKYIDVFGEPSKENLYLYYDRKSKTGLHYFNEQHLNESIQNLSSLTKKIVQRTWPTINIDIKKWPLNKLIETIIELRRFPILILLPSDENKCLDSLSQMHKLFKNVIPNEDVTVMNRLKNINNFGKQFNDYIKENSLNNSLAKNTKIVYIINKRIPKPLLTSEWRPETVLSCDGNRNYTKVDQFIYEFDLVFNINGQDSIWNSIHYNSDTV